MPMEPRVAFAMKRYYVLLFLGVAIAGLLFHHHSRLMELELKIRMTSAPSIASEPAAAGSSLPKAAPSLPHPHCAGSSLPLPLLPLLGAACREPSPSPNCTEGLPRASHRTVTLSTGGGNAERADERGGGEVAEGPSRNLRREKRQSAPRRPSEIQLSLLVFPD